MTPKEKAIKLFEKFLRTDTVDNYSYVGNLVAQQCALIAVDEIIDSNPMYYTGFEYESNLEYWLEVRQEIENIGDNYIVW
jgi:hypothetical protein